MAAVLTGIVRSMREVEGVTQDGPRKGQTWRFLSIEISDPRYGHVWSCQLRDDDPHFADLSQSDLVEHKVKAVVKSQSAAERSLPDGRKIMQIRSQVTNVRDLGVYGDDED
jgi:hypothetical protein